MRWITAMSFAVDGCSGVMVFQRRAVRVRRVERADVAQLVEHHLAKVRVAGSSPVIRSEEQGASQPRHLTGGLAERLGTGLQSRLHRFESGTHLGRLAQRKRASLTRKRSLVRSQYRPLPARSDGPVCCALRTL